MYQPAAASTEAYGAVNVRRRGHDEGSSSSTVAPAVAAGCVHRPHPQAGTSDHLQQQQQQQQQQSMYSPNHAYGPPIGSGSYNSAGYAAAGYSATTGTKSTRSPPRYRHNRSVSPILLPPLLCLLLFHPTAHPLIATLFMTLVLYALDLANMRDGAALGVWLGFALSSLTLLSGLWDDASVALTTIVAQISSSILLLFCLVSIITACVSLHATWHVLVICNVLFFFAMHLSDTVIRYLGPL